MSGHFRGQDGGHGADGKEADAVGVFDNGGGLRYGILNHNYLCTGVRVVPLFGLDHQTAVFFIEVFSSEEKPCPMPLEQALEWFFVPLPLEFSSIDDPFHLDGTSSASFFHPA